ncbi:MAG: AarF/ABC1/UbiB kinase family protein [Myxococcales bacterium]|nr:AarF/ABC1/UbiB kinase family protein [Myxococcales bacterium]MCB9715943.1 AarF/ABC1/UbiB kinase family protein [Myxococcales bacterium]
MGDRPSKLRVAWTAGRLAGRRLLRREVGSADLALGEQLTGQLDRMKGLAMKVGQIVSYMDVPLPEAVQQQLARLQTGQHAMPEPEVRAAIEAALGRPLDELFDAFEPTPVAAASIGQVHRARVGERAVAVKVQYPEVERSFADDLGSIGRFASLASLASAVDGSAIVEELGARLAEECDYQREATTQHAFARAFADDPEVVVPEVVPSRCAPTVLTTTWVDGDDFETLCHDPDDARRNAVARTLVRFSYRCLLELAAIQADPHPGNYVFVPDGTVAFLDFGCVRRLEPAFVLSLRRMITALRDRDDAGFREAVLAMGVVGRPRKFDYEHFGRVMEHLHRPLLRPSFRFGPEFMHEGLALNGPGSPNARTLAIPPAYVWVMRLQWGLWSILGRLRAQGSFDGLLDDLLSRPVRPMLEAEPGAEARDPTPAPR